MPPQNQNQFIKVPPDQSLPKPRGHHFLLIITFLLLLTGAFGVWYFLNPLQELEPENLSVTPKSDKFAGWKTYRNEEYGFEFKYPENLILSKNLDKENIISIHFLDDDMGGKSIDLWIRNYEIDSNQNQNITAEEISAPNSKWNLITELDSYGMMFVRISTKRDGKIFTLSTIGTESKKILITLISTFKFTSTSTPIVDSSILKTYVNNEHGFSFQYPSNLEVVTSKNNGSYFDLNVFRYTNQSKDAGYSRFSLSIMPKERGLAYITPDYNQGDHPNPVVSWKKTEFLGNTAYEDTVSGEAGDYTFLALQRGNLIYLIHHKSSLEEYGDNISEYSTDSNTRTKIISTFKFTK